MVSSDTNFDDVLHDVGSPDKQEFRPLCSVHDKHSVQDVAGLQEIEEQKILPD